MGLKNEMHYEKEFSVSVLAKGKIGELYWVVVSLGTHPVCYVAIPKGHKFYRKGYDDIPIRCHGGLTFAGDDIYYNPVKSDGYWWIGWDYAHGGDYMGYYELEALKNIRSKDKYKKWTTDELIKDAKNVVKQLQKVK